MTTSVSSPVIYYFPSSITPSLTTASKNNVASYGEVHTRQMGTYLKVVLFKWAS